jgi:hypothetical protein
LAIVGLGGVDFVEITKGVIDPILEKEVIGYAQEIGRPWSGFVCEHIQESVVLLLELVVEDLSFVTELVSASIHKRGIFKVFI